MTSTLSLDRIAAVARATVFASKRTKPVQAAVHAFP